MSDKKKKIQVFKRNVIAAGNEVEIDAILALHYDRVTGIAVSIIGKEDGINQSVFNKFEIDNSEVLPEGFEAKLIGIRGEMDVPPDEKFYADKDMYGRAITKKANGSKIFVKYKDGSQASAYPYTLAVYVRLENPDPEMEVSSKLFGEFLSRELEKFKAEQGKK